MKQHLRPAVATVMALFVAALLAISTNPAVTALTATPADPPPGSTFEQRLAQRKAEQNESLDQQTIQHLQQECTGAQTIVRILVSTTNPMIANRDSVYNEIDAILWVNIGRLKLANQKTFTLEQQHTALAQKIAGFESTATNYEQALGDVVTINCSADVVGFQALLDTARAYYAQLITDEKDIFNYTNNNVRPTLQSFINPLQPVVNGSGNTNTGLNANNSGSGS